MNNLNCQPLNAVFCLSFKLKSDCEENGVSKIPKKYYFSSASLAGNNYDKKMLEINEILERKDEILEIDFSTFVEKNQQTIHQAKFLFYTNWSLEYKKKFLSEWYGLKYKLAEGFLIVDSPDVLNDILSVILLPCSLCEDVNQALFFIDRLLQTLLQNKFLHRFKLPLTQRMSIFLSLLFKL